ncbi:hypothetical protein [Kutzneria sp. NPDC052558]|uniref:hypothetical protein n=1 Tax=Kutzneria sp. NPDC052558 TaxID=3364121 RepID=UPI0037C96CBC
MRPSSAPGAAPSRWALATSTTLKTNGAAPGHVATDFNGHRGAGAPEQGAAVVIRLATVDEDGPSGEVFQDDTRLTW